MHKFEAGAFDEDAEAANRMQEYEARIAALERLVGRRRRDRAEAPRSVRLDSSSPSLSWAFVSLARVTDVLWNPAAGVDEILREARPATPHDASKASSSQPRRLQTVRLELLVTDFDVEGQEGPVDVRP